MSDVDITAFANEGNRDLHILYGSQSGNSEGLAEKWQKESQKYGLKATVHDMDGFDINSRVCVCYGSGSLFSIHSTWMLYGEKGNISFFS